MSRIARLYTSRKEGCKNDPVFAEASVLLLAMWFPSVGMFGVVLAIVGAVVSVLEFTGWRRIGLAFLFTILGIGELVSIHKADVAHEIEVKSQHKETEQIREGLRQSEVNRQVDEAYIKAKIEDYAQLRNFAEAIKQFAQADSEYTKRQFQGVVLSNKQLRAKTLAVVHQLRTFGVTVRESQKEMREKWSKLNPDGSDKGKLIQEMEEVQRISEWRDDHFRRFILPDALYVRNELLKRGAKEPPPGPLQRAASSMIVFGGFVGEPNGCDSAADYLEFLLKQLSP